jgi:hypothetical protein
MFGRTQQAEAETICQIHGCSLRIPRKHLMCRRHWFELPDALRIEVESTIANWLGGREGVRPYLIARLRALIHVNKLHGGDVSFEESKLAYHQKYLLEENHATEETHPAH